MMPCLKSRQSVFVRCVVCLHQLKLICVPITVMSFLKTDSKLVGCRYQLNPAYVLITVVAYMMKDRMKEWGKRYLQPVCIKFGFEFPDRIVKVLTYARPIHVAGLHLAVMGSFVSHARADGWCLTMPCPLQVLPPHMSLLTLRRRHAVHATCSKPHMLSLTLCPTATLLLYVPSVLSRRSFGCYSRFLTTYQRSCRHLYASVCMQLNCPKILYMSGVSPYHNRW